MDDLVGVKKNHDSEIRAAIELLQKNGYRLLNRNNQMLCRTSTSYKSILCNTFNLSLAELAESALDKKAMSRHIFLIAGKVFTVSKMQPDTHIYKWEKYADQTYATENKIIWVAERP